MRGISSAAVAVTLLLIAANAEGTRVCDSCSGSSCETSCYETGSYPIWSYSFAVTSGNDYRVRTYNLQPVPGHANATDSTLWLLNTAAGTVLASNDDGVDGGTAGCSAAGSGVFSSCAWFSAGSSFTARAIISSYSYWTFGQATIEVSTRQTGGQGWTTAAWWSNQWFGGWNLQNRIVKSGDVVFVGVPPDGADHTYYANKLLVFSTSTLSCTSSCGAYVEGDANVASLARAFVNWTNSTTRFQVGSSLPSQVVSTRLFHSRLGSGWSGSQYADNDGDGLTSQIEGLNASDASLSVNTCDTSTGPSADCSNTSGRKFTNRVDWDPADTDNDGLADPWEIFGVWKSCTKAPTAPYHDPGVCSDATWVQSPYGSLLASSPLSALGADPRDIDAFFHVEAGSGDYPSATALGVTNYNYITEGLECPETTGTTCQLADYYHVNFHAFQASSIPTNTWHGRFTPLWTTADFFNATFPWYRKHTGVFRYGQHSHNYTRGYGGNREYIGRGHPTGSDPEGTVGRTMTHETAHVLGVTHGGAPGAPDSNQAYPSIMNTGWCGILPPKLSPTQDNDMWPDDFNVACSTTSPCTLGGACLNASGNPCQSIDTGCLCSVDCQQLDKTRFSRGINTTYTTTACTSDTGCTASQKCCRPSGESCLAGDSSCRCVNALREDLLAETGTTTKFTTEQRCWCLPPLGSSFAPLCDLAPLGSGQCGIDWSKTGGYSGTGSVDLDNDGATDEKFVDVNDWHVMYDYSKDSIANNSMGRENDYKKRFRTFQSEFDSTSPTDISAWGSVLTAGGSVTLDSSTPGGSFGSSLAFDGPCGTGCTADNVKVASTPAIQSMGKQLLAGVGPYGFRIDAYVKLSDLSTSHQIIYSNLFEIDFNASTDKFRGWINRGTGKLSVSSTFTVQANLWYWVTLLWNKSSGRARIYVIPRDQNGWDTSNAKCDYAAISYVSDKEPGDVSYGWLPGNGTWATKGNIDEPVMMNYPGCLYDDIDIGNVAGPGQCCPADPTQACADGGNRCLDEGVWQ